jgi:hypothetical protein
LFDTVGKIVATLVAVFIGIIILGTTIEITKLFVHNFSEHGLFFLVVPMAGVSVIASWGSERIVAPLEAILIFVVIALAMIFANTGSWFLGLCLFAAYAAWYAKPVILGCNHLFVRRPLEREALKQQALSTKLDADAELAEATLRYERARAALVDAEAAVQTTRGAEASRS